MYCMSTYIYTKQALESAVENSKCFSEVCRALGMPNSGNSYQRMRRKINEHEIDTSHFIDPRKAGFINSGISEKKHFSKILVIGKKDREKSKTLRRALIESGRLYVCEKCGLGPKWKEEELTLHVDHVNGDWSNCTQSNIRFLCPNCHSQTSTYCNKKGNKCCNCNKKIGNNHKWCIRCSGLFGFRKRKVENRPPLNVLQKEVEELGYVGTGKKYGVSDNSIRKWIKSEIKKILMTESPGTQIRQSE